MVLKIILFDLKIMFISASVRLYTSSETQPLVDQQIAIGSCRVQLLVISL